jgi:ferrous iron transport protein B
VIATVAVRKRGLDALMDGLSQNWRPLPLRSTLLRAARKSPSARMQIARSVIVSETAGRQWTRRLDSVLLHPVGGIAVLLALLFVMFQAVYAWSEAPIGWIETGFAMLTAIINGTLPDSIVRSFLTDGVIAGVGSVVVFLPQILILFLFILLLEASGYMTRAAFVMDRLMAAVGLSGHSFIPLLSSFACAIPGIMATRTIMDQKERLATILIAPLMTCSARLPVYTLIIGAFIPSISVGPGIGLQGLVLFCLYIAGIVGAMLAAAVIQRFVTRSRQSSFLIEMPRYQMPRIRDMPDRPVAAHVGFPAPRRDHHFCLNDHPLGIAQFSRKCLRLPTRARLNIRLLDGSPR